MQRQLSAIQAEQYLNQILQSTSNRKCIICTSPSRQWACTLNAVFLCLSCAAQCKHLKNNICNIKSVTLDAWTQRDIQIMKTGGNEAFFNFMEEYHLNPLNFSDRLCTKAAFYYRQKLSCKVDQKQCLEAPSIQQGRMILIDRIQHQDPKAQKSLMDSTKSKLSSAYDKTKRFTSYTFGKIGQKLKSQQFKQGMSNFGTKTKQVAVSGFKKTKAGFSYLYGAIKNKVTK